MVDINIRTRILRKVFCYLARDALGDEGGGVGAPCMEAGGEAGG